MKQLKTLWALVAIVTLGMSAQAQYYYFPSTTNGNPGGLNADGEYPVGTWLRNPRWSRHTPYSGPEGALIYVKVGAIDAPFMPLPC